MTQHMFQWIVGTAIAILGLVVAIIASLIKGYWAIVQEQISAGSERADSIEHEVQQIQRKCAGRDGVLITEAGVRRIIQEEVIAIKREFSSALNAFKLSLMEDGYIKRQSPPKIRKKAGG